MSPAVIRAMEKPPREMFAREPKLDTVGFEGEVTDEIVGFCRMGLEGRCDREHR